MFFLGKGQGQFESACYFPGRNIVKSKIKMREKLNKQVDYRYPSLYLPSNGKLDMSPKPARWYGNTGFNIVVFVLSFYGENYF